MASSNHFGPALPPSMSVSNASAQITRESWMQDSGTFGLLESSTFDKKETKKKTEKSPECDYSAPGLHVMKKSTSKNHLRLFSSQKDGTSTNDSKHQLDKMKARFKRSETDDDSRYKSKKSQFRAPIDREYSHKSRRRQSRSRSRSPHKSKYQEQEHTSSRHQSPRKHRQHRSRSKSPKINRKTTSGSRGNRRRSSEGSRSPVPHTQKEKQDTGSQDSNHSSEVVPNIASESPKASLASEKTVTSDDLNKISARILKAEIAGNSEKVTKLQTKLDEMKKLLKLQSSSKTSVKEEVVILTSTDSKGNIRPVESDQLSSDRGKKRRKEKISKTHDASGERDKYFPDDKKKNLSDLLEEEKSINKLGQDQLFMKYAGKLSKMSSDRQNWTIDDMFESNIAKEKSSGSKDADRIKSQGQKEHKRLESCQMCLEKCSKDSIVYIGKTLYVRVPLYKSLSTYQCQIVPTNHIIASVNGDEDFWDELKMVKSSLSKKFASKKLDTVFLESAQRLGQRRHIFIDCVPIPMEDGALLPAYFKKAIMDCDVEWAQNKKLVDTRKRSLRKSVPQGLPYFSVEFGTDGGFAHVIEEESLFKRYFGLEVLGGVIECDVNLWRNPEKETSEGLKYKKKVFEKLSVDFSN